jgi:hypothetical protein
MAGPTRAAPTRPAHNPGLRDTAEFRLLSRLADIHFERRQQAERHQSHSEASHTTSSQGSVSASSSSSSGGAAGGVSGAATATAATSTAPAVLHTPGATLDEIYEALEEIFFSKRGYVIPKQEAAMINATGALGHTPAL